MTLNENLYNLRHMAPSFRKYPSWQTQASCSQTVWSSWQPPPGKHGAPRVPLGPGQFEYNVQRTVIYTTWEIILLSPK